jgi:hypothetical protein
MRVAAHHVDHAFQCAVVMRAGLGVRMDRHGAGPDFLRAHARRVDGGGAVHAGRLRGVAVELIAADHLDAVFAPVDGFYCLVVAVIVRVLMVVIVAHVVSPRFGLALGIALAERAIFIVARSKKARAQNKKTRPVRDGLSGQTWNA